MNVLQCSHHAYLDGILLCVCHANHGHPQNKHITTVLILLRQAGVQHFVFSALEDSRPYIQHDESYPVVCEFQGGASKLPFWDAKGAIKVQCFTSHALVARVWLPRISYSSQGLVAH